MTRPLAQPGALASLGYHPIDLLLRRHRRTELKLPKSRGPRRTVLWGQGRGDILYGGEVWILRERFLRMIESGMLSKPAALELLGANFKAVLCDVADATAYAFGALRSAARGDHEPTPSELRHRSMQAARETHLAKIREAGR